MLKMMVVGVWDQSLNTKIGDYPRQQSRKLPPGLPSPTCVQIWAESVEKQRNESEKSVTAIFQQKWMDFAKILRVRM